MEKSCFFASALHGCEMEGAVQMDGGKSVGRESANELVVMEAQSDR